MIRAFYSDPHFGHANIIEYAMRPHKSAADMNEALIKGYNEVVKPSDTCVWLGDCFLMPFDRAAEIMGRLNGHKILILGNHDRGAGSMAKLGFSLVLHECVLNIAGQTCRLNHWPYAPPNLPKYDVRRTPEIEKRDKYSVRRKGEMLIHGHTHSNKRHVAGQIHVGVDAWEYRPVTMDEVEHLIRSNIWRNPNE